MKAKEYIYTNLQRIANLFPGLVFTYEFKESSKTHVVEVKPEHEFSANQEYIDSEIDLTSEFDELFYPESILFISEHSLTTIFKAEKVFKCNLFVNKKDLIEISSKDIFSEDILFSTLEEYALAA